MPTQTPNPTGGTARPATDPTNRGGLARLRQTLLAVARDIDRGFDVMYGRIPPDSSRDRNTGSGTSP